MLTKRDTSTSRARAAMRLMLGIALAAGALSGVGEVAFAQNPRTVPESVQPVDAGPQLRRSLEFMLRASELVTSEPTNEASAEASGLCLGAYRLQRGAQQGLSMDPVRRKSPIVAGAHKHITASRNALLGCTTRFESVRIEAGLEYLRTAIAQTRLAVTLIE